MSEHHRTSGWVKARDRARPIIAATLPARCVNACKRGGIVHPGEAWDVSHIIDAALWPKGEPGVDDLSNLGAAHRGCNRAAGGRLGAAMTNARKREAKRWGKW